MNLYTFLFLILPCNNIIFSKQNSYQNILNTLELFKRTKVRATQKVFITLIYIFQRQFLKTKLPLYLSKYYVLLIIMCN